jgi:hypothetical protein
VEDAPRRGARALAVKLRALGAAGACTTALGVACLFAAPAVTTTACTTHQCDSDFVNTQPDAGGPSGDLQPYGPGTVLWESAPFNDAWLPFPGERTYFFEFPAGFAALQPPSAWVATDPNPIANGNSGATIVHGAGQLAEINDGIFGGFKITNSTCAGYFLYVSVVGTYNPPPAPAPAAEDAGAGD